MSDAPMAPLGLGKETAAGGGLLREQAVTSLRADIVGGRLAPGTRLTERTLCETLAISRTIAREVVRQLEAERLVDVIPHKGLRVAALTPKLVREIYDIRTELEVLIVRAFIAAADDPAMARLGRINTALMAAFAAQDRTVIVERITEFLQHMIAVADHTVAGEILGQLLARINMLRLLSMRGPGRIEASVQEIAQIVQRIQARDAAGAEKAVRAYVQAARASALKQLDRQNARSVPPRL